MLKRILLLSLLEKYKRKDISLAKFEERWGELLLRLSIICKLKFLRRLPRTEEEGLNSKADGYTDLELDKDIE